MNIVWKKPDGSVAITTMTPQALAAIEFVNDKAITDLVAQREHVAGELAEASGDTADSLRALQARIDLHDDVHLRIGGSLERHAEILKEQGGVPSDWDAVAFDCAIPDSGYWINAWVWKDGSVEVDMERARVHAAAIAQKYADAKIGDLVKDATIALAMGDEEALSKCRASITGIKKELSEIPLDAAEKTSDLDALIASFS